MVNAIIANRLNGGRRKMTQSVKVINRYIVADGNMEATVTARSADMAISIASVIYPNLVETSATATLVGTVEMTYTL